MVCPSSTGTAAAGRGKTLILFSDDLDKALADVYKRQGKQSIESYIQTDAAINHGHSGGALVNAQGELIGINAALFAPTGSNTGYGFAMPTSIMKKVVADLKQFGTVQRVKLGVSVTALTRCV